MSFGLTKDTQLQVQVYLKCVYVLYSIYRIIDTSPSYVFSAFEMLEVEVAKWTRCSLAGLQNTLILIQFPDFAATQNLKCEVSSFLASYAFPICTNIIYTLVVS